MNKNGKTKFATSATELKDFLASTLETSQFKLEKIKFSDQESWGYKDGSLSHVSNGFFHVAGVRHQVTKEEHLALYQPQGALTGLALFQDENDIYVLLQARVEPGNTGVAQYGPTIQSTPANYLCMHGGKKTSYVELFTGFHPKVNSLGHTEQLDLGKRYFQKTKSHHYLLLDEPVHTEENMIWASLSVILETALEDNFLNADLRSLLSVFDWDLLIGKQYYATQQEESAKLSLLFDNDLGRKDWAFTPLDSLVKWNATDDGIVDQENTGIWVDLFKVSCKNREVAAWSQPLLCCKDMGHVKLLMREQNGQMEFLVAVRPEFGVSGEKSVLPSYVIYPGEAKSLPKIEGQVLAEMVQCEEGGRFLENNNLYQVILVEETYKADEEQVWINARMLKSILKSSCKASFQLRCISSLILNYLNPITCPTANTLHVMA